jgi:hypothetical protein
MKIDKTELSELFQAEVTHLGELPGGMGLHVTLASTTNLKPAFTTRIVNPEIKHASPKLWALTQECGMVVVDNAYVMNMSANLTLSGSSINGGNLGEQDPPHWDSGRQNELAGSVTMLYKPSLSTRRSNPTLYAKAADFREVLKNFDIDSLGLQGSLKDLAGQIFKRMSNPGYSFSLKIEERAERNFLQRALPQITASLAALIPQSRLYAHEWKAGEVKLVMHINRAESGLLHARAAGNAKEIDPVQGLNFWPSLG